MMTIDADIDQIADCRTITIVGGGPAGLMLAIGLRRAGHAVRLVQDRPAAAIAEGRVLSSQCLFATARAEERKLGLDLWPGTAPQLCGVRVEAPPPADVAMPGIAFEGRLAAPAEAVDQRMKLPAWLGLFERLGGTLEICVADIDLLERHSRESDLVVVATGKGALGALFPLDVRRSPFSRPMRALSMIYLRGSKVPAGLPCVWSTAFPKAGGVIRFPALTHNGTCEILLFEALIGGPLDISRPEMTAAELWSAMQGPLADLLPAEAERLAMSRPTDEGAGLSGAITPAVRHAVGHLPSGRRVLGMGDAVVLNDPLVGQGANNAARTAALFLDAILDRGNLAFDADWMDRLASSAWETARAGTIWTNLSLVPPSPHVAAALLHATADQAMADRFAQGFDRPETILPLLLGQEAI